MNGRRYQKHVREGITINIRKYDKRMMIDVNYLEIQSRNTE